MKFSRKLKIIIYAWNNQKLLDFVYKIFEKIKLAIRPHTVIFKNNADVNIALLCSLVINCINYSNVRKV